MARQPGIEERLARIEERMATRADIAELRELLDDRAGRTIGRRLGRAALVAALAVGVAALLALYTV